MPTHAIIADEKRMQMRSAFHSGRLLCAEAIEADAITVTPAAKILRVSRPALSTLLNAKVDLSVEMALQFETAFGIQLDDLMRIQTFYFIAKTRRRDGALRIRRYAPRPTCRTMTETA